MWRPAHPQPCRCSECEPRSPPRRHASFPQHQQHQQPHQQPYYDRDHARDPCEYPPAHRAERPSSRVGDIDMNRLAEALYLVSEGRPPSEIAERLAPAATETRRPRHDGNRARGEPAAYPHRGDTGPSSPYHGYADDDADSLGYLGSGSSRSSGSRSRHSWASGSDHADGAGRRDSNGAHHHRRAVPSPTFTNQQPHAYQHPPSAPRDRVSSTSSRAYEPPSVPSPPRQRPHYRPPSLHLDSARTEPHSAAPVDRTARVHAELVAALADREATIAGLRDELSAQSTECTELRDALDAEQAAAADLRAALDSERATSGQLRAELAAAHETLDTRTASLDAATAEIDVLRARNIELEDMLERARTEAADAIRAAEVASAAAREAGAACETAREALAACVDALRARNARVVELTALLDMTQREVEARTAENARLGSRLEVLENAVMALQGAAVAAAAAQAAVPAPVLEPEPEPDSEPAVPPPSETLEVGVQTVQPELVSTATSTSPMCALVSTATSPMLAPASPPPRAPASPPVLSLDASRPASPLALDTPAPSPSVSVPPLAITPASNIRPRSAMSALATRLRTAATAVHRRTLPYQQLARLDKPAGTYLLYLPCTWSILMAANQTGHLLPALATAKMLALFGTGAFVMRGAGCTINDLWDRDFDKRVERTKDRPLASGAVTVPQAVGFLGVQLSAGLAVLTQLNLTSIALGASSLVLVAAYPAMKRITYYPQFVLGLTFNWGALLGFTAMTETLPLAQALPLYGAGVCWTLVYDTLYAHQDKADDVHVGVKSTALAFGEQGTKPILTALAVASGGLLCASGVAAGVGPAYFAGAAAGVGNMLYTTWKADLANPASCGWAFRKSAWAGVFVAGGLAVDYAWRLMHAEADQDENKVAEEDEAASSAVA
ncbi:Para-hydroxybenzoate--polyprenyltransferase, mitochondrial precursor (PHB:polyprenyltransferase) [Blastocladiella emersonii ATCC 22665]|nr:Para-hydroxybenzoate--polyprenyltransferase, mitochondrial precursor (PHB:polyprenyltransferase) [Blastocladiella emersonii ATCC 22665]